MIVFLKNYKDHIWEGILDEEKRHFLYGVNAFCLIFRGRELNFSAVSWHGSRESGLAGDYRVCRYRGKVTIHPSASV